jgi:hypothetical protein
MLNLFQLFEQERLFDGDRVFGRRPQGSALDGDAPGIGEIRHPGLDPGSMNTESSPSGRGRIASLAEDRVHGSRPSPG